MKVRLLRTAPEDVGLESLGEELQERRDTEARSDSLRPFLYEEAVTYTSVKPCQKSALTFYSLNSV